MDREKNKEVKMRGLIVVTLYPNQELDSRVLDSLVQLQKNIHKGTDNFFPFYFIQENPFGLPENLLTKRKNIAANLNRARKDFLADGFEYFLNIDSDIIVPPFAINEMIEAGSDIAVGLCRCRYGPPYNLSCAKQDPKKDGVYLVQLTEEELAQRFVEVSWYGFGCILIKRHVIEAIPKFEADISFGVDWMFARECHKRGFKAICCTRIKCEHLLPNGKVIEV